MSQVSEKSKLKSSETKIEKGLIVFDKVGKLYVGEQKPALTDVSFSVERGEFVCLVGPSGSGKSTALKIIAGLEQQSSGTVVVPEKVSMVFQSGALFPWLTVFENVAFGLRAKKESDRKVFEDANLYIDMMGLSDFVDKFPRDLSGGQRQRVGIARALAVKPQVLLLDEPFSALDIKTTEELHRDVLKIWKEMNQTIVMVSHSLEEAITLAERVLLLRDGKLVHEFAISLPRPRREQEQGFDHEIMLLRKEFFK